MKQSRHIPCTHSHVIHFIQLLVPQKQDTV